MMRQAKFACPSCDTEWHGEVDHRPTKADPDAVIVNPNEHCPDCGDLPETFELIYPRIYSVRVPIGNDPAQYTNGTEISRHRSPEAALKAISKANKRLQRTSGYSTSYHPWTACYSEDKGNTWRPVVGYWATETAYIEEG